MGNVDVSDLMLDPDFVSDVVIVRRKACVDIHGENQITESGFPTVGSVQPASAKTVQRLPDSLRVVGLMSFWIRGQIVTDGQGKYPDILIYQGERYEVQTVAPWTGLGPQWCEGTCVRQRMVA